MQSAVIDGAVIAYHRIGYGQPQAATHGLPISDQARHCHGLLLVTVGSR